MRNRLHYAYVFAFSLVGLGTPSFAQDTLKLAVGQRTLFDTSISEVGQRGGIFKKHGLTLEIVYTQGSGETQQAVISGSVDIGVAVGTVGALSAFSKGAPVRIIGAEATGAGDLYWYVKADSPVKTIKDFAGKSIAFSTVGASTHGIVNAFIKENNLAGAKPVGTGSPPATLTQVMSGQVDVGWAAPPIGLDQLDRNEIRKIADGNDTNFRGQTVRVLLTTQQILQSRKPVIERYMKAYRETIEWLYSSDPAALKAYADFCQITEAKAKRIRDEFFAKAAILPDEIKGLDLVMNDAVAYKFIQAPLTKEQQAELIQIPPR